MRSWLLLLLLVAVAVGFEYPCTYSGSDGNFYDFSPLSSCDVTGAYSVNSEHDGTFVLNFCNQVSGCSSSSTAVCQDGSYSCGSSAHGNFSEVELNGESYVVLSYLNGQPGGCPNNESRASHIYFECNPNAATPNISFIGEHPTCNYNFMVSSKYACPTSEAPQAQVCPINVFLVPHTHDDVGWILTIDGYYEQEVKSILDTVVANLMANPERKFIYVEQAYFWRWWSDPNTSDQQRQDLRTLYNNGQFEFVIGGWVMQDEACTTYGADIDQMTLGHQFLYNTFGARPTKGWQIDPFGASSVTSTLNKLAGFDAHLIDRVSLKDYYAATRRLQFNWQGSPSLGEKSQIFTEIMDGSGAAYCDWLGAFDFSNNPVNSGNVGKWAQSFYNMVNQRSVNFLSNNLLAAWGCDFAFQNATPMFESMDLLVDYMQQYENETHIYVQYATLSEYFSAVAADTQYTYPTNVGGDFLPLDEYLWWTGYYTSRTQLKGFVRKGEAAASAVEPLYVIAKTMALGVDLDSNYDNILKIRLANADAQHHDGVTGTSEPDVVMMYTNNLVSGMSAAYDTAATVLSAYVSKGNNQDVLSSSLDSLLTLEAGQTIPVVIHNSLGWARTDFAVIPVNTQQITVYDSNNNTVPSQVNPNYFSNSTGQYNLFFQTSVPAFGFTTYFVVGSSSTAAEARSTNLELGQDTTYTNGYITVTVSGVTGRISNLTNIRSGVSIELDQNLLGYVSETSGAYAFGPKGPASPISSQPPTTTVTSGALVTEIYQEFDTVGTSFAQQTIRIFHSSNSMDWTTQNFVELNFQIGVLPSQTEVVTSFSTSINNEQIFYTDDNGFEFLAREALFSIGIEGNYYPTIYSSYIQDSFSQLTVVSERTHGCSSLADGEFELMIHRNPDMGDGFGPGLTDLTIVYPVVRAIVDTPANSPIQARTQPLLLNFPLTVFAGESMPMGSYVKQFPTTASFLSGALPPNVHFLSLYALDNSTTASAIFRLTHLFAVDEDPQYSKPATVDIDEVFSSYKIASFVETTLTANQVLVNPAPHTVTLSPKEIRTFIIEFA